MTDDQRIGMLMYQYTPVIDFIIDSNKRFYSIQDPIKWRFFFNENPAVTAFYNNAEKRVSINVVFVDWAFSQREPYQIEFFILHELRHWYQYSEMEKCKTDPSMCENPTLTEKWVKESANYVPPLNCEDKKNADYYRQDMETDAFVFSYAVVSYKYGKGLPHLVPHAYENEAFFKRVDALIEQFKNAIRKGNEPCRERRKTPNP